MRGKRKTVLDVAVSWQRACLFAITTIMPVLLPVIAHAAEGVAWADKNWPVRRVVAVDAKLTAGAAGDEIAVAEIPTDGLALADGGDLRVANAVGRFIPTKLLSVGPGTTARVAFPVQPGKNSYAIYYGNRTPPVPPKEVPKDQQLTIRRGLLMDTCTFVGGDIKSYDGTVAAFERARKQGCQGADFVGSVFQGNNWFGPSSRTITRYTGFLQIPANGDYGFATSSFDASFLAIDGKVVVDWGGFHGWVGDARHNKTATLAAGIHDFEYLHAVLGAEGGCVAAWKPPSADKWLPIPDNAFLPVFRATLHEREKYGTTRSGEMTWRNVGEAAIGGEDEYLQRYRFTSQPAGFDAKAAVFTWDFGDGVVVSGSGLNDHDHVYLLDGPADVTLTVTQGPVKETLTNRVVISRDWPVIAYSKLDVTGTYVNRIQFYDPAKLAPAAVARAMEVCSRAKSTAYYLKAGHALATACAPVDDKILLGRMPEYAQARIASGPRGATSAADDYLAAAQRATQPFTRAAMYVGAGRIFLDSLSNDRRAEQCFNEAVMFADRGNDRSIKAAHIGLGDVFRRRGDGAKALSAYQSAEKVQPPGSANKAAVEVGSLARSIEFYTRQGDFETARKHLEEWDFQFPTHKLQGYSTLLWVQFYQAQKMHAQAIQEAADLVGAAERSNYAPQLLIASAESWLALNDKAKARGLLEHVIAVYQDSPLVAEAKKKLAALGK